MFGLHQWTKHTYRACSELVFWCCEDVWKLVLRVRGAATRSAHGALALSSRRCVVSIGPKGQGQRVTGHWTGPRRTESSTSEMAALWGKNAR